MLVWLKLMTVKCVLVGDFEDFLARGNIPAEFTGIGKCICNLRLQKLLQGVDICIPESY